MSTYTQLRGLKVKYLEDNHDPGTAGDVWTLFGTFKRVRNWGFLVNKNWVPFDKYFASNGTLEAQTLPEQYSGIIFPTKVTA